MSIDIDAIEPRRCPICDAGVLSRWDSPTRLSHFVKFTCGFEMRDQYDARPRGWKPNLGSTCRNIDAQSLWSLRRAVDQSAEDFNAEAVARLKAEAEVRELRAALGRARALLKRIEWQDATTRPIYCDIVVCVACGRDHPNHKPDCELSALLVLAGEARP